jgi:hypothetical protein
LGLTPAILATQEAEVRRIKVQGQPREKVRSYLRIPNTEVEHLYSKPEALTLNP